MYVLMCLVKAVYGKKNKQKKTDPARQNSAFCIVVPHMIIMLKFC